MDLGPGSSLPTRQSGRARQGGLYTLFNGTLDHNDIVIFLELARDAAMDLHGVTVILFASTPFSGTSPR